LGKWLIIKYMKNTTLIILLIIIIAAIAFFLRPTEQEPQTDNSSSGLLAEPNAIYVPEQQPGDTVLVPMAVSLGFGVLAATGITLLLIPSTYVILEDLHGLFGVKPAPVAGETSQNI